VERDVPENRIRSSVDQAGAAVVKTFSSSSIFSRLFALRGTFEGNLTILDKLTNLL
jgi:hypothetical protein